MKTFGMKAWLVLVAVVALGVAGSVSYARSTSGFDGAALHPNEATTFAPTANFGTVTSIAGSSGTHLWCIPLPVDSSGGKTIKVTAKGFSSSNVTCTARALDSSGNATGGSTTRSLSIFGSFTQIVMSGVTVPAFGALNVCCTIAPGAEVATVDYNP